MSDKRLSMICVECGNFSSAVTCHTCNVVREKTAELKREVDLLREFKKEVIDELGKCVDYLPAGETWSSMDSSVVQYIRDIVMHVNHGIKR